MQESINGKKTMDMKFNCLYLKFVHYETLLHIQLYNNKTHYKLARGTIKLLGSQNGKKINALS